MEGKSAEHSEQHILIADDNTADSEILTAELAAIGYAVRSVTDGQALIEAARKNRPDLILLDADLPETGGCEVCGRLKADDGLRDIPVIFITPPGEAVDKARLFGTGAADYVTKPVELPEFEARVRTHLELRRQRRKLEQSYIRLREAERLRDNLVHMIAHDLRNSLTAISGYLELIGLTGRDILPEKSLRYVQKGTDAVSTVVGTLTTMLDVSKMQAGARRLNLTRFDLVSLIKKLLTDSDLQRGSAQLFLDEPFEPVDVIADHELVQRVARIFLANGLKSAGNNGIVRVCVEAGPEYARVSIEDNGPGTPPDRIGKIFDKFGKAEGAAGSKSYSEGLGFTFCRLAVEAHGGRVGVESAPGSGSTFWFEVTRNP